MADGDYERRDNKLRELSLIKKRLKDLRTNKFLKGAIFDQDGLLFDTEILFQQSWKEAGRRMGVEVPESYVQAVRGCGRERLREIIQTHFHVSDIPAYIRLAMDIVTKKQLESITEKPGLHELLELLKSRGIKMAVASSSTRFLIEHNLNATGIAGYFDAIVCGDDVQKGKPHPDIFLLAASKLNLSPRDCWVFEDAPSGIRAAHAAGCSPIMIPDRAAVPDEIRPLTAGIYPSLLAFRDHLVK